jgi:hypothetical protein
MLRKVDIISQSHRLITEYQNTIKILDTIENLTPLMIGIKKQSQQLINEEKNFIKKIKSEQTKEGK